MSRALSSLPLILSMLVPLSGPLSAQEPVKVKVFVASMFEIGENSGDRAGEFQHWYERYWADSEPIATRGALGPPPAWLLPTGSTAGLRRPPSSTAPAAS